MSDMPDLSKIVNLIMENPTLIAEISALAKGDSAKEEHTSAAPEPIAQTPASTPASIPAGALPIISKSEKRQRLLSAMKPYLKDERSRAIDSMLSVAEILDMVRR